MMNRDHLAASPEIRTKLRELELQGYLERLSDGRYGFTERGAIEAQKTCLLGDSSMAWAARLCGYVPNNERLPPGQQTWQKTG